MLKKIKDVIICCRSLDSGHLLVRDKVLEEILAARHTLPFLSLLAHGGWGNEKKRMFVYVFDGGKKEKKNKSRFSPATLCDTDTKKIKVGTIYSSRLSGKT
ncbi:hypothetical protein TNCV_3581411 [Trichonephila clavipes]|nr:hypothetical protein TNCV_3581411 [Trichonephila clavipes]